MTAVRIALEQFEQRQAQGRLWVVANRRDIPVGFASAGFIEGHAGYAHLEELDVHPRHGRRGLGTMLLDEVCKWAWRSGCNGVVLSTMKDIPWNEPFYAGRGFSTIDESDISEPLQVLREAESRAGLPVDRRVFMERRFRPQGERARAARSRHTLSIPAERSEPAKAAGNE